MTNKKIVNSRGVHYLQPFPVSKILHPLSKPLILFGLMLGAILVYMFLNKLEDPDNTTKTTIIAAYSCFYLLMTGLFAGLSTQQPPHKLYTFTVHVVCAFLVLCFIATLLTALELFTTPTIKHTLANPNSFALVIIFFGLKVPSLLRHWRDSIERMTLEIQESFHK